MSEALPVDAVALRDEVRPSIGMSPSIRAAASTSTPDEHWRDDWATTRTSSPECLRPPLRRLRV